jgi:uncharacterized membrane protein
MILLQRKLSEVLVSSMGILLIVPITSIIAAKVIPSILNEK